MKISKILGFLRISSAVAAAQSSNERTFNTIGQVSAAIDSMYVNNCGPEFPPFNAWAHTYERCDVVGDTGAEFALNIHEHPLMDAAADVATGKVGDESSHDSIAKKIIPTFNKMMSSSEFTNSFVNECNDVSVDNRHRQVFKSEFEDFYTLGAYCVKEPTESFAKMHEAIYEDSDAAKFDNAIKIIGGIAGAAAVSGLVVCAYKNSKRRTVSGSLDTALLNDGTTSRRSFSAV